VSRDEASADVLPLSCSPPSPPLLPVRSDVYRDPGATATRGTRGVARVHLPTLSLEDAGEARTETTQTGSFDDRHDLAQR